MSNNGKTKKVSSRGVQAPLRNGLSDTNQAQNYQSVRDESTDMMNPRTPPTLTIGPAPANASEAAARPTAKSQSTEPVYRQYILDRVSGDSYVSRHERTRPTEHSNDDNDNDNHISSSLEPPEDSSSSRLSCAPDRPIHFLCYVPLCVRNCPGLMEDNSVCRCIGRAGCNELTHHSGWRRRLFLVGIVFNLCSVILIAWASMAFSTQQGILTRASFWRGEVWETGNHTTTLATLNMGFRAIAVERSNGDDIKEPISSFGDFCRNDNGISTSDGSSSNNIFDLAYCGECQAETYLVQIVFNLFIVIRNIMYDHTRMYPSYDLNCPSFHGKILSVASVVLGLVTINTYHQKCFQRLESSVEDWYQNVYSTSSSTEWQWRWWPGPGMICLMVATFLRFIDMACNFLFPAPTIAKDKEEQRLYELEFGPNDKEEQDVGGKKKKKKRSRRREEYRDEVDHDEEAGGNSGSAPSGTSGVLLQ